MRVLERVDVLDTFDAEALAEEFVVEFDVVVDATLLRLSVRVVRVRLEVVDFRFLFELFVVLLLLLFCCCWLMLLFVTSRVGDWDEGTSWQQLGVVPAPQSQKNLKKRTKGER